MKKSADRFDQGFGIVLLAASGILFIKLYFSNNVYGTNDITYWYGFSRIIEQFGTFKIYAMTGIYNHPPLMSWVLKLISFLHHKTQLSFPYLFRLMPIIADFLSVLVIWELLKKYAVKNKVAICLICAFNPINFLISGFHGNTDTVFIFFILCSLYLVEENKFALAGLFYGLSICIKVVPIILIPLFFYFIRSKDQRTRFFIYSLLIPLFVFLPYLIYDLNSVIKNIFFYNSLIGIWGTGHVFYVICTNHFINVSLRYLFYVLFNCYVVIFKPAFFIAAALLIKYLVTYKKSNLMDLSFLTFSLFLAFTPGFSVQYLSWLSYFAIVTFPLLGSIYVLLGGVFLYRVYVFWGAGKAPYYANSIAAGQWVGSEVVLDILLWMLIVIMLIKFMIDRKVFSSDKSYA